MLLLLLSVCVAIGSAHLDDSGKWSLLYITGNDDDGGDGDGDDDDDDADDDDDDDDDEDADDDDDDGDDDDTSRYDVPMDANTKDSITFGRF